MSAPLAGRGVVISRPAGEAQRLAALIREAGGEPLLFPAMEILDAPDAAPLDALIDRLDDKDMAIFISPSAVQKAAARITARRPWPAALRCAAIGPGGVRALQGVGVREVIAPAARDGSNQYDSEALLASPFMQAVRGLRIVIFRGDGGRDLLGDTLIERGALVEYAVCYRRGAPTWLPDTLRDARQRHTVAAVIVTSSEGLRHFHRHIGADGQAWLRDTLMVVPHPRIGVVAHELGITRVVESASGDEAMVRTLLKHVGA